MYKKLFSVFLMILFVVLPVISNGAIVNCGNNPTMVGPAQGNNTNGECDFTDFVGMLNGFVDWIIGSVGVVFTISLIYGGFLYMTSGENPGNKEKAKTILKTTLYGFIIILCAWLIVYTLITYVVDPRQQGIILKFIK